MPFFKWYEIAIIFCGNQQHGNDAVLKHQAENTTDYSFKTEHISSLSLYTTAGLSMQHGDARGNWLHGVTHTKFSEKKKPAGHISYAWVNTYPVNYVGWMDVLVKLKEK